ncbi:hypothetical protein [Aurantibacter sp.]|uniref:hypothetical protein n=1 Tax=Aurantibacter sp. TaxID=2807103 RepID=UPI0035C8105E
MKVFTYILTIVAVGLIIYNITLINFESPFQDKSLSALITILAGLCAILLLQILRVSKKIELKSKGK